jgi:hypothetical protein
MLRYRFAPVMQVVMHKRMTKTQTLSLILIICGFFLLIHTYYYHQKISNSDLRFARILSHITSSFQSETKETGPSIKSGSGITMEIGVLSVLMLCEFMMICSLGLIYINKKRSGYHPLNLPLGFASIIGFLWVLYTINFIGLFGYA